MINKELVKRLIKDVSKSRKPWQDWMHTIETPRGTPSLISSYIQSYYPSNKNLDTMHYGPPLFYISEKLEVSMEAANTIAWPELEFAHYQKNTEGYISKPMVVKFLKNLLKEEDPKIC